MQGEDPFDSRQHFEARVSVLLGQRRHADACTLIVTALGPEVRGYLRAVLHDDCQGDDLYQDLCAVVCQQLPCFAARSSVRTWVYGIAHHLVLRFVKRYSQRKRRPLDMERAFAVPQPGLTSLLQREQRQRTIEELLLSLTPAERELIILRIERRLSFRDMAAVLELSEDAVRQRFQRAKERLKERVTALGVA